MNLKLHSGAPKRRGAKHANYLSQKKLTNNPNLLLDCLLLSLPKQPLTKVRDTKKTDYDTTHKDCYDVQPPTKVRETKKADYDTTHEV